MDLGLQVDSPSCPGPAPAPDPNPPGPSPSAGPSPSPVRFPLQIDLDTDSDNDEGLNVNFERDAWNDHIEDSLYAIGKMIFTYDSETNPRGWAPMKLHLVGEYDSDAQLSFSWRMRGESSGSVDIWKKPKDDPTRTDADKLVWQGVDYTKKYNLSVFDIQNGIINFWLAPSIATAASDFRKVDSPKPEDFITATVWNPSTRETVDDTIKYMIIESGYNPDQSFYTALQATPHLRSAGAAEAVYGNGGENDPPRDNVKFTLEMLTERELKRLFGSDPYLRNNPNAMGFLLWILTTTAPTPDEVIPLPQLVVRLYLDYSDTGSGRYILSYRGTDFTSIDDWIANIQNQLSAQSAVHKQATQVGQVLGRTGIVFDTTGHSLGGGLAAAAALESQRHAVTFNAAGINPDVFWDKTRPNTLEFPTAWANYPNRNNFIDTYSVWYVRPNKFKGASNFFDPFIVSDCPDILTTIQFAFSATGPNARVTTFLPDGVFHPIEGLIDLTNEEYLALTTLLSLTNAYRLGTISFASYNASVVDFELTYGIGDLFNKLANSHNFDSIYFGMLHNTDGWNAYDRLQHPGF